MRYLKTLPGNCFKDELESMLIREFRLSELSSEFLLEKN